MISRYLVITLAFIAAGFRASQGAWVEAAGLASLGAGLTALKIAERWPAVKPLAYLCFLGTALSMVVVLIRQYY